MSDQATDSGRSDTPYVPHLRRESQIVCDGGWWPPGQGEGPDWDYEKAQLSIECDGDDITVCLADESGRQKVGLVSFPINAAVEAFLRRER